MVAITEEQYKLWRDATMCASVGNNYSLKKFKEAYPELYRHMMSMLNKRTKICKTLQAYMSISPFVYWGSLTFNEEEDVKDIKTKRKQVQRYLEKYFKLYLYVEELGEEEERWHIHYLGILRDYNTKFEELYNAWHSRSTCECLYTYKDVKKKVKYITKYVVKDVPRIHMNNRSILLIKQYKKYKHYKNIGFDCFAYKYIDQVSDLLDLPF